APRSGWSEHRDGRRRAERIGPAGSWSDVDPSVRRGRVLIRLDGVQLGLHGRLAPDILGAALDGLLEPLEGLGAEPIALQQPALLALAHLAPELVHPRLGLRQLT